MCIGWWSNTVAPHIQRFLHSLGAIFAILLMIGLAIVHASPWGEELLPDAAVRATIVTLLLAYVVYAHRRTKALVKAEAEQSRQEAERTLARLRATPVPATAVGLRWRVRTYVLFAVALIGAGTGAVVAWSHQSWLPLALLALAFVWAAKPLLARLSEPDVLRVGPNGIEDRLKFGMIAWPDITSVLLHEYEIKGAKAANLSIGVRNPEAYMARLGPVARFWLRLDMLISRDLIRLPIQTLDIAPPALFGLVRAFHERAAPAGAILGNDKYYEIDVEFAKMKQAMAALEKSVGERGAAPGAPSARARELMARMDAVIRADRERISKARATVEKTNWLVIVPVALGLSIALLVGAGLFGR